ncbi:MAG: hypothetical protein IJA41_10475 [Clostridia bacterium]|nr:hypothetical protein [Clostridia bacterium]
MAKRPIFVSIGQKPFVKTVEAEFLWHGGFAVSQQQKNILALHTAFKAVCPEKKVLEISSKSMQPLGVASELLKYDAFTDIVFNPQKGINCQAHCRRNFLRSCA